ncbi:MAG TPA: WD40 repeat domain-containing protein [Candidatus Babeliales bacterium]|nr:WD40 repeat domain-containing protein [Candidatus Babeliales bacterium]
MFIKKLMSFAAFFCAIFLVNPSYASYPPPEKQSFSSFLKGFKESLQKEFHSLLNPSSKEIGSSFELPPENSSEYASYKTLIANSKTLKNMILDNKMLSAKGGIINLPVISEAQLNDLFELIKYTNFDEPKMLNFFNKSTLIKLAAFSHVADYLEIDILLRNLISAIAHRIITSESLSSLNNDTKLHDFIEQFSSNIQSAIAKKIIATMPHHFNYLKKLQAPNGISALAFQLDGTLIASGNSLNNEIILWDFKKGEPIKILRAHEGNTLALASSPMKKTLASASNDGSVIIWNLETREPLHILIGHTGGVVSIAYNSNGSKIASGSIDDTIIIWDTATGKRLQTIKGARAISSIAYNPNDITIASGNWLGMVNVWDLATEKSIQEFSDHHGDIYALAFSPDGKQLASGGADDLIIIRNVEMPKIAHKLIGHKNTVKTIRYNPTFSQLASGSLDKTIIIWDLVTGNSIQTLAEHDGSVNSLSFSSDGTYLASGSADDTIIIWQSSAVKFQSLSLKELLVFFIAQRLYQQNKINQFNPELKKIYDTFPKEVKELAEKNG